MNCKKNYWNCKKNHLEFYKKAHEKQQKLLDQTILLLKTIQSKPPTDETI